MSAGRRYAVYSHQRDPYAMDDQADEVAVRPTVSRAPDDASGSPAPQPIFAASSPPGNRYPPTFAADGAAGGGHLVTFYEVRLLGTLRVLALFQAILAAAIFATCWVPYVVPDVAGVMALLAAWLTASRCQSLTNLVYDPSIVCDVCMASERGKLHAIATTHLLTALMSLIGMGLMILAATEYTPPSYTAQHVTSIICAILSFCLFAVTITAAFQFTGVLPIYDRLADYCMSVGVEYPEGYRPSARMAPQYVLPTASPYPGDRRLDREPAEENNGGAVMYASPVQQRRSFYDPRLVQPHYTRPRVI